LTYLYSTRIEDTLVELRRYMQRILQFVTSQTGGPTGFASWWRIEPMKLEDALGNCILIPLEAVVSWEVRIYLLYTGVATALY
jgi:hypothetical protein